MNLDHIIAARPDIVVLDWLSTDETDVDSSLINIVFEELRRKQIRVICTSFLRADTWEKTTPLYEKMWLACERINASFLDFRHECDRRGLGWSDVTRDGVHTNKEGAAFYAEVISEELARITSGQEPTRTRHPNFNPDATQSALLTSSPAQSKLSVPEPRISFCSIGAELAINVHQRLRLTTVSTVKMAPHSQLLASIWCMQTVGPFSPMLNIRVEGQGWGDERNLLDRWCHYARFAYKEIASGLDLAPRPNMQEIMIEISDADPTSQIEDERVREAVVPAGQRLIRLHDRLACLNCAVVDIAVEEKQ